MKNSNNTIGNRARDLQAFSVVPQATAPARASIFIDYFHENTLCIHHWCPSVRLPLIEHSHLHIETDPLQFNKPNFKKIFFPLKIYFLGFVYPQ